MKTTIKTALFVLIAALGFFNLKIDKATKSEASLSFVENSASANFEAEESKGYFLKDEITSHVKNTITKPGGGTCVVTYDQVIVSCLGEGSQRCTPSVVKSNEHSTC
ncbi:MULTISPECIES: hypothetical protein [Pedobacter]|uniref:hypothetical protein n=1 Tax=Pedobacter TaxID=84567 RepID=UPI00292EE9F7|nr:MULTISPECIES: hypothetical protein [Pedobacter]